MLAVVAGVLLGRKMLVTRRPKAPALDAETLAVHQIKMNLGCNGEQARRLLKTYNGDANQAIMDVKTGRTVLPGEEVSGDLPQYAGQLRLIRAGADSVLLVDHNDQSHTFGPDLRALLVVGILDSDQRPNKEGLGDAARGRVHAQLFVSASDGWKRFRVEASKLNYTHLGDRMHNQASRNFHEVVDELVKGAPNLHQDSSVEVFLSQRRAPIHTSQAALEKAALDAFAQLRS